MVVNLNIPPGAGGEVLAEITLPVVLTTGNARVTTGYTLVLPLLSDDKNRVVHSQWCSGVHRSGGLVGSCLFREVIVNAYNVRPEQAFI